ncbi:glycosyltransferase family 2 protein [Pedobacter aquatilis]|uniref:glycosyltransferase family 2 protein n=1 Tax=Pedobacter aquatilis TaxID=351343 RepID=UPI0029313711|nr:galactosyltransferase-related protein [Pedobacter aquatilis]
MSRISLVTLVKNRQVALQNMIKGVLIGSWIPDEMVIVHMSEKPYSLEDGGLKIRQVVLDIPGLPLAAARNFAVQNARFENIVFLDADCIPAKDLLSKYSEAFSRQALLSGRTRYLPIDAMQCGEIFAHLEDLSHPDPVRSEKGQYPYEQFWSLNFGCSKSIYKKIGGYDEGFTGYGAEDTDFAFLARKAQVPLVTIDAFAFHQYHPSYDPPINHLKDIVSNALRFKQKWQQWPMSGWLAKFQSLGLIKWTAHEIELLRMPSSEEINLALKTQ